MGDRQQPPLNWEASAETTNAQISPALPPEVETCLKNARFLHLATCTDLHPHISLMNYTYLPSTPFHPSPTIIMTTNPSSKKTLNLLSNPRVSLLVHDWVSHRPPTTTSTTRSSNPTDIPTAGAREDGSPPSQPQPARSSLATLLLNMNTSALSSISATINGEARMVERGSEEERWCKERHLENNTFGGGGVAEGEGGGDGGDGRRRMGDGVGGTEGGEGDGGASCFIEGEEVRVVVVGVREGRIADWKGGVKDWKIAAGDDGGGEVLVNGTAHHTDPGRQ